MQVNHYDIAFKHAEVSKYSYNECMEFSIWYAAKAKVMVFAHPNVDLLFEEWLELKTRP